MKNKENQGSSPISQSLPRLTHKEYLILELLLNDVRGLYGLQIVDKSEGVLKKGTVYVLLQRMQEKGLVDSKCEPRIAPEIGIARRIYCLTGYGALVHKAFLAAQQILTLNVIPVGA
jgi:Predicted transcriptional regulators